LVFGGVNTSGIVSTGVKNKDGAVGSRLKQHSKNIHISLSRDRRGEINKPTFKVSINLSKAKARRAASQYGYFLTSNPASWKMDKWLPQVGSEI
jgi:hypothetical protein